MKKTRHEGFRACLIAWVSIFFKIPTTRATVGFFSDLAPERQLHRWAGFWRMAPACENTWDYCGYQPMVTTPEPIPRKNNRNPRRLGLHYEKFKAACA